jgi:hypothetical protein
MNAMNVLLGLLLLYFGGVALWAGARVCRRLWAALRCTFAAEPAANIAATMPPRRSLAGD